MPSLRRFSAAALVVLAIGSLQADRRGAPAESLERLRAGNRRFSADASESRVIDGSRRAALTAGQTPFATVLSCADSRVPPELVFNTGLGELFVVRVAGEVADRAVLASVEYAVEHLHTPLVLVMGHEFCGAVKAAAAPVTESRGSHLDFLLSAIRPAVERSRNQPSADALRAAIVANVEEVINDLVGRSDIVRAHVAAGKVEVVGGFYEMASGRVHFSSAITSSELKATRADPRR